MTVSLVMHLRSQKNHKTFNCQCSGNIMEIKMIKQLPILGQIAFLHLTTISKYGFLMF